MKFQLKLLVLIAACSSAVTFAHSNATGVIKERMDGMNAMATHSKTVADMFKGKQTFEASAVREAAQSFIDHGQLMVGLFPDTDFSRTGKHTRALSAIWDDAEAFEKTAEQFVMQSERLLVDAQSTTDEGVLKKSFFVATKNCSSCHKRFRQPKN